MTFWARALGLIICIMVLGTGAGEAKDKISWRVSHFPPIAILEGPDAGQGYADRTQAYMIERMPAFTHVVSASNFARTWNDMKQRDGVCFSAAIKTAEREHFALFSDPVYWVQPNRLIIPAKSLASFEPFMAEDGGIDLGQLIADRRFIGQVTIGRKYGSVIDDALTPHRGSLVREAQDLTSLFHLMDADRVHWVIGYATEASYFSRHLSLRHEVATIAISGSTPFINGYFACSDGPLGELVIAEINKIIRQSGQPPSYFAFQEEWLDPTARTDLREAAFGGAN